MKDPLSHFIARSGNAKTGPISLTLTEESSCPTTCPLKGHGCYASYGRVLFHWSKVPTTGISPESLFAKLRELRPGAYFRHNVAGDLWHNTGQLIPRLVLGLAAAAAHLKAWTYTHHVLSPANLLVIREAISRGFCINISTETPEDAASSFRQGLPTVLVVPPESPTHFKIDGIPVIQCPANTAAHITCSNCGGKQGPICARTARTVIVAFWAHGAGRKKAAAIARGSNSGDL